MTTEEVGKLEPGLYRVWWIHGAMSEAAVGLVGSGPCRWMIPTERATAQPEMTDWSRVKRVERIDAGSGCVRCGECRWWKDPRPGVQVPTCGRADSPAYAKWCWAGFGCALGERRESSPAPVLPGEEKPEPERKAGKVRITREWSTTAGEWVVMLDGRAMVGFVDEHKDTAMMFYAELLLKAKALGLEVEG